MPSRISQKGMDRSVAGHFVRKLCANAPGSTRASALPGSELQEKTLVRERRLGDLNPGRARTLTALAVLFLSSQPMPPTPEICRSSTSQR